MVEVTLTENELRLANKTAELRQKANRDDNIHNRKKSSQGNIEVDKQGMAGEIAVAKYLNLYPDQQIETGAGGVDLTMHTGTTLDVKTTHHSDGMLISSQYKANRSHADLFVLVTGHYEDQDKPFNIRGYRTAEDLFQEKNLTWITPKSRPYAIPQQDLQPIKKIKNTATPHTSKE